MCLMEFVSLDGDARFTDHPRCTHPALAALARGVNDRVSDRARPRLARLVPALRGTDTPCPSATEVVLAACARRALVFAPGHRRLTAILARTGGPVDGHVDGRCADSAPLARRRVAHRTEMAVFDTLGRIVEAVDGARRDAILDALLVDAIDTHRRNCPRLDPVAADRARRRQPT